MQTRHVIAWVLGGLMIGIGVWILAAGLMAQRPPITQSRALDYGFAAFFILRGAMNIHRARLAVRRAAAAQQQNRTPASG
jgi:hypothetical protein